MLKLMSYYFIPYTGDFVTNMMCEVQVGATRLDYLPLPKRSLKGTMPYNVQVGVGQREWALTRALWALPFLGLSFLAAQVLDVSLIPGEQLGAALAAKQISWPSVTVPIADAFYHIPAIDDTFRPITVFFAPSSSGHDQLSWWQMISFLTDFGVIYSILLIEAGRRANALSLIQFPIILGILAQLMTIGRAGTLWFFYFYINSQVQNFTAPDMRLTSMRFTSSVLPSVILGHYIPLGVAYLASEPSTRHAGVWIWQLFPVWVCVFQYLFAWTGLTPDTIQKDRLDNIRRDYRTIQITIVALVAVSAATWVYLLTAVPFSMIELFIPEAWPRKDMDLTYFARIFLQWDEVFMVITTFTWLTYSFWDLKAAGMMKTSWLVLVLSAAGTLMAAGPGATIGLAWLWREQALAFEKHKGAVLTTEAMETMWYEKSGGQANGDANGHAKGHAGGRPDDKADVEA